MILGIQRKLLAFATIMPNTGRTITLMTRFVFSFEVIDELK